MSTFTIVIIAPTVVAALVLVAALFRNAVVDVRSRESGGYEIEMRED
jgi:hypothetical protein